MNKNLLKKFSDIDIGNIVDILLMVLVLFQSIKKGGFYISDMNYIAIVIMVLSFIYCIYLIKSKKIVIDTSHILLMCLSISYLLPIVFKLAIDVRSAIWETIKYLEMFLVFFIVFNSKNIKYYEQFLIFIGVVIGIFGIDGISSRIAVNFLKLLNSGYLSTYLERMSSFIQYANTCAILLTVSLLISFKYLIKGQINLQKNYILKNNNEVKLMVVINSFLTLCVFLSQSRFPIILSIIRIISDFI